MSSAVNQEAKQTLVTALQALQAQAVDIPQTLAEQVVEAYQQPHRYYHTLEHIETLSVPMQETEDKNILFAMKLEPQSAELERWNQLKTLAAFGHDCVYQGSDDGLGTCKEVLTPFIRNECIVAADKVEGSPLSGELLGKIYHLFDVKGGEDLKGKNEFLSALVVATLMQQSGIAERDILVVSAVTEATIPFREPLEFRQLKQKLLDIGFRHAEAEKIFYFATHFANEDVKNFRGATDAFVRNSFRLSPEFDPSLRGMAPTPKKFMRFLHAEHGNLKYLRKHQRNIFHSADSTYPPYSVMQNWLHKAVGNLEMAEEYYRSKMVASAYIHALAMKAERPNATIADLIPESKYPMGKAVNSEDELLKLLLNENGKEVFTRDAEGNSVRFDIKNSPLTAALYSHLGKQNLFALYEKLEGYIESVATGKALAERNLAMHYSNVPSLIGHLLGKELASQISGKIADGGHSQTAQAR